MVVCSLIWERVPAMGNCALWAHIERGLVVMEATSLLEE
uniref:Uncharacterized protein n=1 Tax=Arundo donax TaxID=35708 RepID=A0A0A9GB11_ARUDO